MSFPIYNHFKTAQTGVLRRYTQMSMKNLADLGGCYPPLPLVSVDNTLLDLQKSSYPSQPHSIVANSYYYNNNIFIYPVKELIS